MARTKVLAIGLDAADSDLVSHWCEAGELPVLASLRERGVSGVLSTPPGLGDDAVWSSFATGLSPGRHGRYFHRQLQPGRYDLINFREARGALFWETLSDAGRRVAILDVPKCRLSTSLNGLQVNDWLVHGRDGVTASYPPQVAADLLRRFGDDMTDRSPEYLCTVKALSASEQETLIARVLGSVQRKAAAAADLLRSDDWDLFLVVFKEAHCAGHHLWHVVDRLPSEPATERSSGESAPLLRVYRALDEAIGQLLHEVDRETDVIVFSTLGMGRNVTGEHLLDAILLRLDGFAPLSLWQRLQQRGERAPLAPIRCATRAVHDRLYPYRTAFQLEHNETSGAVRINVEGREPRGRVRPGRELEAVLDRLTDDLLALVDSDSGEAIVESVVRTDEAFAGACRDSLPDLLVVWNRNGPITGARSPRIGEVRLPSPAWRTGNHVGDGFFHAFGPSVVTGAHCRRGSIVDLGPTIGSLLGVAFPDGDGRPIPGFTTRSAS